MPKMGREQYCPKRFQEKMKKEVMLRQNFYLSKENHLFLLPMANITLFAQAIGKLPKENLRKIIREEKTDRHSKGYDTWSQFISMMFCQFSGCDSVRDISNGLNSANGNLNHLGICRAPSKSTVAYQNAKRSSTVFRRIFYALVAYFGQQAVWQRTKFRFRMPIKLLDSQPSR